LLDLLRDHRREVVVGMGLRFAQNVLFYVYTVFVLSYGEETLGYPRSTMLHGIQLASLLGLVSIPLWSPSPTASAGGPCTSRRGHLAAVRVPVLRAARARCGLRRLAIVPA